MTAKITDTLIPPPQVASTNEEWESNPVYVHASSMQEMEWEIVAVRSEIIALQVSNTTLITEKEGLEQQLDEREMANEDLLDELQQTDQRLQRTIKITQANEKELQERIRYLEEENEQGKSEFLERIAYLERKYEQEKEELKERIHFLEREGQLKEKEIKQREKECERVEELFKGGNDVNGLILDLKGRLKKQDEELHEKSTENDFLRLTLGEKLAFQQTFVNLGGGSRHRTTSDNTLSNRSTLSRQISKLPQKQQSLPAINLNPQSDPTMVTKKKRMSIDVHDCHRIYETPTSPTPESQRVLLSLKWHKSNLLGSGKQMVRGTSVYSQKEETLFFSSSISQEILAYKSVNQKWFSLPQCPHQFFGLAIVDDYVTAIGGITRQRATSSTSEGNDTENGKRTKLTNRLVCYVKPLKRNEESWMEIFPSMPTERSNVSAVCVGTSLIVAGGDNGRPLQTVEVMDTRSKHWYTATSLPKALSNTTLVLCEDTKHLYLMGEDEQNETKVSAVYNCSAQELVRTRERVGQPQSPRVTSPLDKTKFEIASRVTNKVWYDLPNVPTLSSTLVVINSHVVAIGGISNTKEDSDTIYDLDVPHSKWEHIAHIPTARHMSLAGFDPSTNKLVVVGGFTKMGIVDSVDIAHMS